MTQAEEKHWKKLAEQVALEKDPKKLMELAEQLSEALAAGDSVKDFKPTGDVKPSLGEIERETESNCDAEITPETAS
jgi:hypothetical protein